MVVSVSDKNPSALHPYAVGTVKLARAISRLTQEKRCLPSALKRAEIELDAQK